jgi:hypothetical protein
MYREIALDPLCMGNMEYYSLIKQHFGYEKGRYIAADIKVWAREAMQAVKRSDLKPVRAKSVKNFINKVSYSTSIDLFTLSRVRRDVSAENWNTWWEAQNEIRKFSCTISESGCPECVDIDQINDGSIADKWDVPPSVSVKRTTEDIISNLEPLVSISNEITIIDQYFRVDCNNVLESLISFCSAINLNKLTIVSSQNTAQLSRVYLEKYKALNVNNIQFSWVSAPDKFFHVRFFITDKGTISSDPGFMESTERGAHSDCATFGIVSKADALRATESLRQILEDGRASSENL